MSYMGLIRMSTGRDGPAFPATGCTAKGIAHSGLEGE